jgi:hypothetical protein
LHKPTPDSLGADVLFAKLSVTDPGLGIGANQFKRLFHYLWGAVRIFSGSADFAGAKTCCKGRFKIGIKLNVFPLRLTSPAYRKTKNACRFDANKKHTGISRVAFQ